MRIIPWLMSANQGPKLHRQIQLKCLQLQTIPAVEAYEGTYMLMNLVRIDEVEGFVRTYDHQPFPSVILC